MKTISAVQLKTITAKDDTAEGFDLSSFGVSLAYQGRSPSSISYPTGFNPLARSRWLEMFDDEVFVSTIKDLRPGEQWVKAIEGFLEYCRFEGVDPFKQASPEAINTAVRTMLYDRRRRLVRLLDVSQLFAHVRYIRNSEKHRYHWLATGAVRVTASLQFEMSGREELSAFARSPKGLRMFKDGSGNFTRNLLKDLTLQIIFISGKKAALKYSLEIRPPFYLPDDRKTLAARHDWMDKQFFFPMIRGQRLANIPLRAKF